MTYLFPILLLAIGAYVLYSAIVGKGRLFALDNIKDEEQDKVRKLLRLIYVALAVIMLVTAAANFGQSVLYSKPLSYYEVTDAYAQDFADIIHDGKVTCTVNHSASFFSCTGNTSSSEIKECTVAGQHDVPEMNALLIAANNAHPDKFTDNTQQSMFSCLGTSGAQKKIMQYYKEIQVLDADGNRVYESTIGAVRSDANDGSFISKMYRAFSNKLLRILSYVFMGLAVLSVVAIFVILRKFTDKEKEAKARTYAQQNTMPSSAFNFDDDEKSDK